ncbi:MAG: CopG family transcriptional regulator [Deltaproteobacteria bacterium]|nr:CopG family transcriptional regulator [Deltaproteobacteria bacterium]MBW2071347.1 CopG family transcriptional regulator [Deltaproteobacteria bacterium]
MIRTQIQIEEEQMQWLRTRASQKKISISQLIRESIAFFREHEERITSTKKERALAALGLFDSGLRDVSERHDDYLADLLMSENKND